MNDFLTKTRSIPSLSSWLVYFLVGVFLLISVFYGPGQPTDLEKISQQSDSSLKLSKEARAAWETGDDDKIQASNHSIEVFYKEQQEERQRAANEYRKRQFRINCIVSIGGLLLLSLAGFEFVKSYRTKREISDADETVRG